jgi:pimeloyl-ACP methyl ester carboxylesterase
VPTLIINGKYDIAQDFVVEPLFRNIPRVKWVRFENSSHTPFWEERQRFVELVADFLAY